MTEFKRCPFCGGKVETEVMSGYREMTFFRCDNPDCLAFISFNRKYGIETEEQAIEAWNRRVKEETE